jgi:uncharacterized protein YfdQ (DUF2303 family)
MPENTTPVSEMQVVVDTAKQAVAPNALGFLDDEGTVGWFAVPDGVAIKTVDRRGYLPRPARQQGTVTLHTGGSLADYVNRHKTHTDTVIYADVPRRTVVAVLNDHPTGDAFGEAGWADHRAVLNLQHTDEWKAWTSHDGHIGGQQEFAEFIEDHAADILSPPGADLLELAQTIEATTSAAFKSQTMLDNGQRALVYEETIETRAGQRGQLEIPREFTLQLRPFDGGPAYKVTARLRVRIREGRLAIGYVLHKPEDVVRAAFDDVLVDIGDRAELPVLFGVAPAARA